MNTLSAALEIAKEKAENMQARASALEQLAEAGVWEDQAFSQSGIDHAVDEQLQKMISNLHSPNISSIFQSHHPIE